MEEEDPFLDSGQDDDSDDQEDDYSTEYSTSDEEETDQDMNEGWEWQATPPTTRQARSSNIIRRDKGIMIDNEIESRLTAFNSFMSSDIKQIVVKYTNDSAQKEGMQLDFDEQELDAWIALLIIQGVTHQRKTSVDDL